MFREARAARRVAAPVKGHQQQRRHGQLPERFLPEWPVLRPQFAPLLPGLRGKLGVPQPHHLREPRLPVQRAELGPHLLPAGGRRRRRPVPQSGERQRELRHRLWRGRTLQRRGVLRVDGPRVRRDSNVLRCTGGACCVPSGQACTTPSDCCDQSCVQGTCCKPALESCTGAADCCAGLPCTNGECCSANGGACQTGGTCCSSTCGGGTCCQAGGTACTTAGECCGGLPCTDGLCCQPVGSSCTSNNDCCGGIVCTNGVCCGQTGCNTNSDCCGGLSCGCAAPCPANVCCVPPNGACTQDADCCGGPCVGGICCDAVGDGCLNCCSSVGCLSQMCSCGFGGDPCNTAADCCNGQRCSCGVSGDTCAQNSNCCSNNCGFFACQ